MKVGDTLRPLGSSSGPPAPKPLCVPGTAGMRAREDPRKVRPRCAASAQLELLRLGRCRTGGDLAGRETARGTSGRAARTVPWVKVSGRTRPLRPALHRVVTDGGRHGQPLLAGPRARAGSGPVRRGSPHAGQAVGLELHPHRERVRLGSELCLHRWVHLVGMPSDVLDVVTDLVGDDVGLGEVAGRAKRCARGDRRRVRSR